MVPSRKQNLILQDSFKNYFLKSYRTEFLLQDLARKS